MFGWYKFLFTTVSLVVLISKVPKTAPCWRSNTKFEFGARHIIFHLGFVHVEHGPPASDIWKYVDI